MKNLTSENYNLKPYTIKRIFWFNYGLYYEDCIICYGGYTRISDLRDLMNAAFLLGVSHAIVMND